MPEDEIIAALARSLYWGYLKDRTGTPGKWSDLSTEDRKIWQSMARRAIRRVAELSVAEQSEMPG